MNDPRILAEMTQLVDGRSVGAEEVLAFRRTVYGKGFVTAADAESLFAVNAALEAAVPEWSEFFVEAVSDFVVHQAEPRGYITADNARWLMRMIAHDGVVHAATELEALVRSLEVATTSPDFLAAFALDQVRHTVIAGSGPYARGGHAEPGVVTAGDVAMLRRILYAYAGDGNIAVTRAEAEVLFELNEATRETGNDFAWGELFVRATANYLMAQTLFRAPDREEALARQKWLDEPNIPGSLLGGMLRTFITADVAAVRSAFAEGDVWQDRNRAFAEGAAETVRITAPEVAWLAERIGRDGTIHGNERALLEFLKAESPDIHPSLAPLFEKAGIAA